jgi:phosphoglycerate dehydrogenase-like enzyme
MMNLLLLGKAASRAQGIAQAALQGRWQVASWSTDESDEALVEKLAIAHAVIPGPDALLSGRITTKLAPAPQLQFMHVPFAGVDWLKADMIPPGCSVCNVHEHSSAIAEYVMLAMLEWQIGLRRIEADFRAGSWAYGGSAVSGKQHGELSGKTLGIIGYGHIGSEVAHRAKAFGLTIHALGSKARTADQCPPELASWGGPEDLPTLLAKSDFLVLACPLSSATQGLIGATQFKQMKSTAVLINVARGPVVDEEALFNALSTRQISGAVLDTWYHYPTPQTPAVKPSRFDFASLDNVIMTPHCAGWTDGQEQRRWGFIIANLERFRLGQALESLVMRREAS